MLTTTALFCFMLQQSTTTTTTTLLPVVAAASSDGVNEKTTNNNVGDFVVVPEEDTEWGRALEKQGNFDDARRETSAAAACSSEREEEESVEVAIVGGGLVGLAVAIGLSRNDIPCRVYERAPALRSVSQGILAIQPNGMNALSQIHPDIPGLILEAGCERRILVQTRIAADGTVESETVQNSGDEAIRKWGRRKVGMTWHRMQRVLASLLPADCVVTSRSLVRFVEDTDADGGGGSVRLVFENGSVVRARAVLACDGVFSAARRQLAPGDDSPIFFGQINWATIIETDKLPPGVHPPSAVHYFHYDGGGSGGGGDDNSGRNKQNQGNDNDGNDNDGNDNDGNDNDGNDNDGNDNDGNDNDDTLIPRWMSMLNDGGSGYTFWQFRVADPDKAMALSGSKGRGGLGLKGTKDKLLAAARPSPLVSEAIRRIPESQIFERSIVSRYPLATWLSPRTGRLALVGDAAHGMHPNIAQGANNAFESAAAVVGAMIECKRERNWKVALEEYEKRRKPRADLVQGFSNMMGVLQATGKEYVSKRAMAEMVDWIVTNDPAQEPPEEVVRALESFDPCDEPGISRLW